MKSWFVFCALGCLVLSGCATRIPYGMPTVHTDGRHESHVGSRQQVEDAIVKYNLDAWDVGHDVYAEGRTYNCNFVEFSTREGLLDGCATDGCAMAPEAKQRPSSPHYGKIHHWWGWWPILRL